MRTCVAASVSLSAALIPVPHLGAQAPLAFEVASVKRAAPGNNTMSMRNSPGQFATGNLPLRMVITQAYALQGYQVVGGPSWIESERWDIVARMPEGTSTQDQRREMVRTLLADRFKLVTHMETRELPIYALVTARSDRKLGPELRQTATDCAAVRKARAANGPASFNLAEFRECGLSMGGGPGGAMAFRAQGMAIAQFARLMESYVDRPIFDRTELSGEFDVEITFTPERGGPPRADLPASEAPSIFTALQERLGLTLEPTRGPIEVLVIDSIEQPTED
jgi:uncharacterized protein (TIGR03435 family)